VSTLPTLVLHFVLSTIFTIGSPASAFAEYLKAHFAGSLLVFKEFVFNLNGLDAEMAHFKAVGDFMAGISGFVISLGCHTYSHFCCKSSFSRVFVFVTTHSDDESGELFAEENGRLILDDVRPHNFSAFIPDAW
jgi:hypothetical protein